MLTHVSTVFKAGYQHVGSSGVDLKALLAESSLEEHCGLWTCLGQVLPHTPI